MMQVITGEAVKLSLKLIVRQCKQVSIGVTTFNFMLLRKVASGIGEKKFAKIKSLEAKDLATKYRGNHNEDVA